MQSGLTLCVTGLPGPGLTSIRRLSLGNPGQVNAVGEGVSELKLDYRPGDRIYFVQRGSELVFLLAGGDKASQAKDIKMALQLARDL